MISISEFAKLKNISVQRAYQLRDLGRLKVKNMAGLIVVTPAECERWKVSNINGRTKLVRV